VAAEHGAGVAAAGPYQRQPALEVGLGRLGPERGDGEHGERRGAEQGERTEGRAHSH
jgi:hypothetical protein